MTNHTTTFASAIQNTTQAMWDDIQRYVAEVAGRDFEHAQDIVDFMDIRMCPPLRVAMVVLRLRRVTSVPSTEVRTLVFRPETVTLDAAMIRTMRRSGFSYTEIATITDMTPVRIRKIEAANADPSKARVI